MPASNATFKEYDLILILQNDADLDDGNIQES